MTVDDLPFTPTQKKMVNLLADGKPHTKEELHKCLWDGDGHINNIHVHLACLRRLLRMIGEDVFCIRGGGPSRYIRIRLSAADVSNPPQKSASNGTA